MSERTFHDKGIDITVTRSAGEDGAFVVFIDTANWEPDGSDGGPGLRVLLNDGEIFNVIPYGMSPDGWPDKPAGEAHFNVALDDVDYTKEN